MFELCVILCMPTGLALLLMMRRDNRPGPYDYEDKE